MEEIESPMSDTGDNSRKPLVSALFWLIGLLAGMWQAWLFREIVSNDGISYLDMARGIAAGNWNAAINGYWSPLYPIALSLGLLTFRPGPTTEFAIAHLMNFLIYVAAFAAFEFLLRSLLRVLPSNSPIWLVRIAGYCFFIWSSLALIGIGTVSPDLLLSVFIYWAMALLIRILAGDCGIKSFVLLGVVLGVGCLAKAPLVPLTLVIACLALLAPIGFRDGLSRLVAAAIVFAAIVAPYVISLSISKGRLTFGDSGALNYAWYVDGATYRHWQGGNLGVASEVAPLWSKPGVSSGVPLHATRKVLADPPVYEFGSPVAGTYPVWSDPSYWNDGIKARFDIKQQIRKIVVNLRFMYSLLLNVHLGQLVSENQVHKLFSPLLLCLWAVLAFSCGIRKFREARPVWLMLLFSCAALGMYALVYCEPRHLAAFVVLLYVGLFALLRNRGGLLKPAGAVLVVAFFAITGFSLLSVKPGRSDDRAIAATLKTAGVLPGAKIASVEYSNHGNLKWAHLAEARIVSELYTDAFAPRGYFWKLDSAAQERALNAFRGAGAQFVVASDLPRDMALPQGWTRVGTTKYIYLRLQ